MKKKNIIIIICLIVLVAFLGISALIVSYGYVTSDIIDDEGKGKYYIVENLRIEYSDGSETLTSNQDDIFIPGSVITKTFTVKNTGSNNLNFNITFTDIINTFNRKNDIVYEIYTEETLLSSGIFPDTLVNYIVGDVNLDGVISEEDYTKFTNFINNNGTLTRMEMITADLNLDNTIDGKDSPTLIREYINMIGSDEGDIVLSNNVGKENTAMNVETILYDQSLEVNASTTYTLKIKYLTSQENQIEDSGKTIDAKISFEQS